MNRTEKQALIDDLHEEFGKLAARDPGGLPRPEVPAVTEFRRKVRQSGSRYRVVKNTLALRARQGHAAREARAEVRATPRASPTPAPTPWPWPRSLVDFAKDHPSLVVKAGLVSGSQMLDAEGVKALSTMPSLPELRAKLLGLLNAPATQARPAAEHAGRAARPGAEGAPGQARRGS